MTRLDPHRVQPSTAKVWRLYRVWRADGVLLYIGVTGREPLARLIEHLYEQAWSHEIARWEVDPQPHYAEGPVLAAELAAIRAEKPIRNWVGNEGPHRQWQPKVASYRHPGRRPARPVQRWWQPRWSWWLAAWVALVVGQLWTLSDIFGQELTAQVVGWTGVVAAGVLAWWRWHGRSWLRRRWLRLWR